MVPWYRLRWARHFKRVVFLGKAAWSMRWWQDEIEYDLTQHHYVLAR
jgi:hypothetical protein